MSALSLRGLGQNSRRRCGRRGNDDGGGATDPDVVPDVVSVDESADEVETTTIADVADAEEASAQQEPTAQDPGDPSTDDVPQDDAPNTLEDKADESPKARPSRIIPHPARRRNLLPHRTIRATASTRKAD
jgi:hypothetical protein